MGAPSPGADVAGVHLRCGPVPRPSGVPDCNTQTLQHATRIIAKRNTATRANVAVQAGPAGAPIAVPVRVTACASTGVANAKPGFPQKCVRGTTTYRAALGYHAAWDTIGFLLCAVLHCSRCCVVLCVCVCVCVRDCVCVRVACVAGAKIRSR